MLINFDRNLLDLRGNASNEKISDLLADALALTVSEQPAKMMAWAVNLVNNAEVDLTDADITIISKIIEKDRRITNLAKVQILEILDKNKS